VAPSIPNLESAILTDLLVLRQSGANELDMFAVESKWYKHRSAVGGAFVSGEFGENGQLRMAVATLRSLFDPQQDRLDKDYWQRTIRALLDKAPSHWQSFCNVMQAGGWNLRVDGLVYVHLYTEMDRSLVAQRALEFRDAVARYLNFPADERYFGLGANLDRLRLKSYPELAVLFKGVSDVE
jgi:hypothetical protein